MSFNVNRTLQGLTEAAPETGAGHTPETPTHANGRPTYEDDLTGDEDGDVDLDTIKTQIKGCEKLSEEAREEILAIIEKETNSEVDDTLESLLGHPRPKTESLKELRERVHDLQESNSIRAMIDDAGLTFKDRRTRDRLIKSLVPLSAEDRRKEITERVRVQHPSRVKDRVRIRG
jgi:hypothetical protein